ncbi:MAG TPA: TIGR03936 family radical SAM-associated protein, partial [Coleofasciculaceae cyanobacterium]
GLTNEELLRGVKTAWDQGWDKSKLYFMIGLPGETDADVLGIAETVRWLQRECGNRGRKRIQFTLTISNFTPKPHTPFQWHTVSTAEFLRKQSLLRQEFRTIRGLKANFTDVRISAMEDFIGRGDRRLAPVVRRAWELGAGMDSWWESLERAFGAWQQAIEEAGLDWKYRQVEAGEWNAFGEGEAAPGAIDPAVLLDRPVPWDHLDSGVDKQWLKEDLQRALEAATVPDCSFDGCSHCGVCGYDFGTNVVVPPPVIPVFQGQFKPNQTRAQRVRLRFAKRGEMALLSHLDLMRLLDRAVRRAAIPISYTGGFHPSPRIVLAHALSLGTTSEGEILDLELTAVWPLAQIRTALAEQLPPDLVLLSIEDVPLKDPAANQLLDRAEYEIDVRATDERAIDWAAALATVLDRPEWLWEKTTKSGKTTQVNLRDWLDELTLVTVTGDRATLHYCGLCRNDGQQLRPEHVTWLIEQATERELILTRSHRCGLILTDAPVKPPAVTPDMESIEGLAGLEGVMFADVGNL